MKKYTNLATDRYFLQFQELPHEIKKVSNNMYLCSSANHKAKIEIKDTTPQTEAILYYVFY